MIMQFQARTEVVDSLPHTINSIIAGAVDPIIDIHIERGIVTLKAHESGYGDMTFKPTTRSAQEDFQERIEREGAAAFDYKIREGFDIVMHPDDDPVSGCHCNACMGERERRGF